MKNQTGGMCAKGNSLTLEKYFFNLLKKKERKKKGGLVWFFKQLNVPRSATSATNKIHVVTIGSGSFFFYFIFSSSFGYASVNEKRHLYFKRKISETRAKEAATQLVPSAPCLFIIFLAPSASHFHGLFFISDYNTQQKTAFLFLSLVPVNP